MTVGIRDGVCWQLRAELMAQRQKNYTCALKHDMVVGLDTRVLQGVLPRR